MVISIGVLLTKLMKTNSQFVGKIFENSTSESSYSFFWLFTIPHLFPPGSDSPMAVGSDGVTPHNWRMDRAEY